jgi:hypothetical protein
MGTEYKEDEYADIKPHLTGQERIDDRGGGAEHIAIIPPDKVNEFLGLAEDEEFAGFATGELYWDLIDAGKEGKDHEEGKTKGIGEGPGGAAGTPPGPKPSQD